MYNMISDTSAGSCPESVQVTRILQKLENITIYFHLINLDAIEGSRDGVFRAYQLFVFVFLILKH